MIHTLVVRIGNHQKKYEQKEEKKYQSEYKQKVNRTTGRKGKFNRNADKYGLTIAESNQKRFYSASSQSSDGSTNCSTTGDVRIS